MLRDDINTAVKEAMKAKDERKLSTLRMVNSTLKNADIAARGEGKPPLSDADILAVLQKMIKQRQESKDLYEKGGRPELAQQEADDLEPLQARNAAPEIQTDAGRHDWVGAGDRAVRRGEDDVVPGVAQDAPAYRDFRRIEVGARQRNQHPHVRASSSGGPSRRRRCIQATSCQAPNLRPIDRKTPIGSKPRLRCRAMLASFGNVAPANALQ